MAEPTEPLASDFSIARLFRLARKELRETLRDRRTILTLVLMPLLVYPLLGLTFQKFLLTQATALGRSERPEYVIGFRSERDAATLNLFLARPGSREFAPRGEVTEKKDDEPLFRAFVPEQGVADVAALVESGVVDIGVRFEETERDDQARMELIFNSDFPAAVQAKREIEDRIRSYNEFWYRSELRDAGRESSPPFIVETKSIASSKRSSVTIAAVVPFILLLMTVTGAVYPAIDLTAGERERGTLEALTASPVSRSAILVAKYLAVLTVAMLTAGMNLIAMTATAFSLGLDRMLFGGGINPAAISQVVALALVLAAFFSAVLLLVTSFARSFKEAQAYLIPVMLVSLAPGVVSLMPDLPLTLPLAATPLIGVVLLARDLLTGSTNGLLIAVCVGSTLFYAATALWLAARFFGTDAVLYGSGGTWTELFRRPERRQAVPPVRVAVASLAIIVPAFLLLGPLAARWEGLGVSGQLAANAVVMFLLFFGIPATAAIACRAVFRSTFQLKRPSFIAILGGALLGVSLWPFAFELEILTVAEERITVLRELFEPIREKLDAVSLWVKLVTLAIVPAIAEEWFFRGFLLSSLRSRLAAWLAVLVSGLLFGAFHVIVQDGLFFERMVPTAFLGLILGVVCVRTGSLWPGMLLHVMHNGLLLTIAAYEQELIAWGWSGGEQSHLPWTWLVAAGVMVAIGGGLVAVSRRREVSSLM